MELFLIASVLFADNRAMLHTGTLAYRGTRKKYIE